MIKKIKVEQLKPGFYIHDLNCGWLRHPFLSNKLKVENKKTIERIIKYGIHEVYIDTDKGLDITDAPAKNESCQKTPFELNNLTDKMQGTRHVPLKEEMVKAKEIIMEAKKTIQSLMEDVRLGKQIEIRQVEHLVEKIAESIFNNRDALISLGRIKQKDEYTYKHSLSVCALLISFGEHLHFDYKTLKAIGVGGLLHDIGKVKVPAELLNKKRKLSQEELENMKEHVKYGCAILKQNKNIDEESIVIAAHHHERFDGTGYPDGLKENEISLFGQMSAIADVYDALTSDRCYQDKILPTAALKKLFELHSIYFNKDLVEQFICCVGIYPVGTLVRLESGLLGVVVDHGEKGLLYPVVRIVYDTKKERFITPYDINLSSPSVTGLTDTVTNYESPEKWGITPEKFL